MRNLIIAALLALSSAAYAQIVPAIVPTPENSGDGNSYAGPLVNETGLAYSKTFALELSKYNTSRVSAQVIMSSTNFSNATFVDGAESTGTATVLSYLGMSSATATNNLTVVDNHLQGAALTVNGIVLAENSQWNKGATAALSAASLASAIHTAVPAISASATGAVIYTTATYGSYANAYAFSSNTSSITVSKATMTGGQDNAVLTINGTQIKVNTDFSAVTSIAQTATNLASAIGTKVPTLVANSVGAVIYATSTLNGTAYNYTWSSSSPTALSVTGSAMTGGLDQKLALSSKNFQQATPHGLTLGLPVLYAVGTNPAIGGLTTGTTYYAAPVSGLIFQLAKYSTSAVAGTPASDFVTVTSTNSSTTQKTYNLVPLAWSGSSSFVWQASNDGSNYATVLTTGTVTFSSATANLNSIVDFGSYNFRYLRFSFTKPTTGGASIVIPVVIKQDGVGRF